MNASWLRAPRVGRMPGVVGDGRGSRRRRAARRPHRCRGACRSRRSPDARAGRRARAAGRPACARRRRRPPGETTSKARLGRSKPARTDTHSRRPRRAAISLGHARRGGRGGGHHGRAPERGDRVVQAQVVGAEVVAPLGDAVGLVDDEQRDRAAARGPRGRRREAKRSGAASTSWVSPEAIARSAGGVVPVGHARGEHRGGHAGLVQTAQLVGHQRDQRADDDHETVAGERGQLVAERLAPAGGHHDERVAPVERGRHGLALPGPEGVEPETAQQCLGRVHPKEGTHRFGGDSRGS